MPCCSLVGYVILQHGDDPPGIQSVLWQTTSHLINCNWFLIPYMHRDLSSSKGLFPYCFCNHSSLLARAQAGVTTVVYCCHSSVSPVFLLYIETTCSQLKMLSPSLVTSHLGLPHGWMHTQQWNRDEGAQTHSPV